MRKLSLVFFSLHRNKKLCWVSLQLLKTPEYATGSDDCHQSWQSEQEVGAGIRYLPATNLTLRWIQNFIPWSQQNWPRFVLDSLSEQVPLKCFVNPKEVSTKSCFYPTLCLDFLNNQKIRQKKKHKANTIYQLRWWLFGMLCASWNTCRFQVSQTDWDSHPKVVILTHIHINTHRTEQSDSVLYLCRGGGWLWAVLHSSGIILTLIKGIRTGAIGQRGLLPCMEPTQFQSLASQRVPLEYKARNKPWTFWL